MNFHFIFGVLLNFRHINNKDKNLNDQNLKRQLIKELKINQNTHIIGEVHALFLSGYGILHIFHIYLTIFKPLHFELL